MMTYQLENRVSAKTYLEFAVHLLDLGYFNSMVFCHDRIWFDRKRYADVSLGFINLLSYLNSCGIILDTELEEPTDMLQLLYKYIMEEDESPGRIVSYELHEADFTEMNVANAVVPDGCKAMDFALVRLYLLLRTGASLNKRAMENAIGTKLTDAEILTVRKNLENITGRDFIKRKDNSYEMGGFIDE